MSSYWDYREFIDKAPGITLVIHKCQFILIRETVEMARGRGERQAEAKTEIYPQILPPKLNIRD